MVKKTKIKMAVSAVLVVVMIISCGLISACKDSDETKESTKTTSEEGGYDEDYSQEDYSKEEDFSQEDEEYFESLTLGNALKSDEYKIWYRLGMDSSVGKSGYVDYVYVFDKKKNMATIYEHKDGYIATLGDLVKLTDDVILKKLEKIDGIKKIKSPYKVHVYTDDTGNNVQEERIEFDYYKYDFYYERDVYGEVYDGAYKGVGKVGYTDGDGTKFEAVTRTDDETPFAYDDIDSDGVVVD